MVGDIGLGGEMRDDAYVDSLLVGGKSSVMMLGPLRRFRLVLKLKVDFSDNAEVGIEVGGATDAGIGAAGYGAEDGEDVDVEGWNGVGDGSIESQRLAGRGGADR